MNKQHIVRDSYKDFEGWVEEYYSKLLLDNNFELISKKWNRNVYGIDFVKGKIIISFATEYLARPTISLFNLDYKLLLSYSSYNCKKIPLLNNIELGAKVRIKPKLERFTKLFSEKEIHNMEELKEDYNIFGYLEVKEILRLNAIQLAIDLREFEGNLDQFLAIKNF